MPRRIAFLFPGQGSQYVGMGKDLFDRYQQVKEIFQYVDDLCKRPISTYCFEGPLDDLTLTVNLQPAITAVNLACMTALRQAGLTPSVSAGHSLGEYAALASAGVVSPFDALTLVNKRGELMHRESLANPGKMAAIIGMDISEVEEIVKAAGGKGVLSVANHNTAEQIVISGQAVPLEAALEMVKKRGKKAIPLKVSGAWHCALMNQAVTEFRRFMEDVPFRQPEIPLFFNATAQTKADAAAIKDLMAQQLVSPVRWYDIISTLVEQGVDTFVEVGPKTVLSGLCKKIIPSEGDIRVANVQDTKTLDRFLEGLPQHPQPDQSASHYITTH
ncbi:MAG: ACP S-malonyltransferase [Deltaproteobacteria bacterium]|nr:ACP S-malonyltransferase [Deltaproteobacteria bacterium]